MWVEVGQSTPYSLLISRTLAELIKVVKANLWISCSVRHRSNGVVFHITDAEPRSSPGLINTPLADVTSPGDQDVTDGDQLLLVIALQSLTDPLQSKNTVFVGTSEGRSRTLRRYRCQRSIRGEKSGVW